MGSHNRGRIDQSWGGDVLDMHFILYIRFVLTILLLLVVLVLMPWRAWRRWRGNRAAAPIGIYMAETVLLSGTLLGVTRLGDVAFSSIGLHWVRTWPFFLHAAISVLTLIAPDLFGIFLRRAQQRRFKTDEADYAEANPPQRHIIALASICVVGAFWEELCFRGTVFYLAPDGVVAKILAILASSIIFGLHHLRQGPSAVILTSYFGILLFLLYICTRDLFAVMAAHAISNMLVTLYFCPKARADKIRHAHNSTR